MNYLLGAATVPERSSMGTPHRIVEFDQFLAEPLKAAWKKFTTPKQIRCPLLDREFLEKLERLTIHWQKSFAGLVGGHNTSHFPGSGQEFLDHRNFHHGDDLRAVNWRAYLRLEKMFLKMFQVEPHVPVR